MRKLILLIALATLTIPALADTAQQEKMKACNTDATAKSLKGDEREKFMSTCLKG
ncbi:MAG TPA: PsiF family protein [Burkholderiales bacterium]|nr:PsiF family protein [Burkholderiales bacterium]